MKTPVEGRLFHVSWPKRLRNCERSNPIERTPDKSTRAVVDDRPLHQLWMVYQHVDDLRRCLVSRLVQSEILEPLVLSDKIGRWVL